MPLSGLSVTLQTCPSALTLDEQGHSQTVGASRLAPCTWLNTRFQNVAVRLADNDIHCPFCEWHSVASTKLCCFLLAKACLSPFQSAVQSEPPPGLCPDMFPETSHCPFLNIISPFPDKVGSLPHHPLCRDQSPLIKPASGSSQCSLALCSTPSSQPRALKSYNRPVHLPFLEGSIARNN